MYIPVLTLFLNIRFLIFYSIFTPAYNISIFKIQISSDPAYPKICRMEFIDIFKQFIFHNS